MSASAPVLRDVVVAGAGPVGATLALALCQQDLDVVALDARAEGGIARGDRALALSHGARLILERVGVWSAVAAAPGAVTPIQAIDVSQAGGFGRARIDAQEHGVPALGYVVAYRALQAALDQALRASGMDVRFGATVTRVASTGTHARVVVAEEDAPIDARLAVAADGAGSLVDGIARERRDYRQVAIVAKVTTDRPHEGLAYERFTPQGPIALLPEHGRYGLVWTHAAADAQATLDLPDAEFLALLTRAFGSRAGAFQSVSERRSFPLVLEYAQRTAIPHVVAIGNAAQALHPIAGQGLNLGLRDAFELSRVIADTPRGALGDAAMLRRYAQARAADRRVGIAFTNGLVHLFGGASLRWPRGIGLAVLDALPPLKRAFTHTMLHGWR